MRNNFERDGKNLIIHFTPKDGATERLTVTMRTEAEASAMESIGPYFHQGEGVLKVARRLDGRKLGTSFEAELRRYRSSLLPVVERTISFDDQPTGQFELDLE